MLDFERCIAPCTVTKLLEDIHEIIQNCHWLFGPSSLCSHRRKPRLQVKCG